MKRVAIVILGVLVILIAMRMLLSTSVDQQAPGSPIATITPSNSAIPSNTATTSVSYCIPQNLQAAISLSPGAGNIYGTLTLKNISSVPCFIIGNNSIVPSYDQMIKNISITNMDQPVDTVLQLAPSQTVYSQIHYPNGPQCSESTQTVGVTFTYSISADTKIAFSDQTGDTVQNVTACISPTEITTIQVWSLSPQPIIQ